MRVFIFGLGYSCLSFARHQAGAITGTVRSAARRAALADSGVDIRLFDGANADPRIDGDLDAADVIIVSVPPGAGGDPVLAAFGARIAQGHARVIYLSTVGVYTDHAGAWIDESAAVIAGDDRRGMRARTEAAWRACCGERLRILRLAGIYGPGRNALCNLAEGRAHRIVKPGQVFNRIHVTDIAQAIAAAAVYAQGGVWNICDDEPAPPQDVVTYAAELMKITPPPEQDFASADLSPMARSFYATSNRISNARMKRELGVTLRYPTYRSGLDALYAETAGR